MDQVAAHFETHSCLGVDVPRCIAPLSSRRLLVMDFVEGVSLRDHLRARLERACSRPVLLRWPTLFLLQREAKARLSLLLDAQV